MKRFFLSLTMFLIAGCMGLYAQASIQDGRTALYLSKAKDIAARKQSGDPTLAQVRPNYPITYSNGVYALQLLVQCDAGVKPDVMGGRILSGTATVLSVSIPVEHVAAFLQQPSIRRAEAGQSFRSGMDEARVDVRADKVHEGRGLSRAYKGKDVIVGVFDTGIDVLHPDFSSSNGTRIMYLWDMSDKNPDKSPDNYNWGAEYTKADIDGNPSGIAQQDLNGHGTHVAGIAAGGGMAMASMTGIAPEADLIVVKGTRDAMEDSFADGDIIAGCQYMFEKAAAMGKPIVVNLSLGTLIGPHDGTTLLETALSELVGPGRLIVAAAGNEGTFPIHAGGTIAPGEYVEALIQPQNICELIDNFCPDIPGFYMVAGDVWYTNGSVDTVFVTAYSFGGGGLQPVAELAVPTGTDRDRIALEVGGNTVGFVDVTASVTQSPGNNDGNIFITIDNGGSQSIPISQYMWSFSFVGKKAGSIDLWAGIPTPEGTAASGKREKQIKGSNSMTVGSPGTGKKIINVGSYVTKNKWINADGGSMDNFMQIGRISTFSSRGPTRDNRLSPIISAPGEIVFSAMSGALDRESNSDVALAGYKYYGLQGTSMAAPVAAGTLALWLERNKTLDYEQAVNYLRLSARTDSYTGTEPNNTYGYGKLDAQNGLIRVVVSVEEDRTDASASAAASPNPALASTVVVFPASLTGAAMTVHNSLGAAVQTANIPAGASSVEISTELLAAGAYYVVIAGDAELYRTPFVVVK